MRKIDRFVVVGLLSGLFVMGMACSPSVVKTVAKGAIDVALAACIAEHPDDDEAALKEACHWADDLAPLVKDLIGARTKGMAKHDTKRAAAGPACAPAPASDAGTK